MGVIHISNRIYSWQMYHHHTYDMLGSHYTNLQIAISNNSHCMNMNLFRQKWKKFTKIQVFDSNKQCNNIINWVKRLICYGDVLCRLGKSTKDLLTILEFADITSLSRNWLVTLYIADHWSVLQPTYIHTLITTTHEQTTCLYLIVKYETWVVKFIKLGFFN